VSLFVGTLATLTCHVHLSPTDLLNSSKGSSLPLPYGLLYNPQPPECHLPIPDPSPKLPNKPMTANAQTAFLRPLNNAYSQNYSLTLAQEITIGRDPSCHLALDPTRYTSVSRRHATIRYRLEDRQFEITDLNSANGIYVNGQPVIGNRLLQAGDRITFGTGGPEFTFEDPAAVPATIVQPQRSPQQLPQAFPQAFPQQTPQQTPQPPIAAPAPAYADPGSPSPVASAAPPKGNPLRGLAVGLSAAALIGGLFAYQILRTVRWISAQQPAISQPSPNNGTPSVSPTNTEGQTAPPSDTNVQSYADPSGLFQLLVPANYTIEDLGNGGVIFSSSDQRFQGVALARSVSGQLSSTDLESNLTDKLLNTPEIEQVEIQDTFVLANGTVQVDWVGREAGTGAVIDAASFASHNGSVYSELNLFGVNSPFSNHVTEAQLILDGFDVRS
jgi:pSer/pThr/pTyr-binding forkhead associated (FHA) protein